MATLTYNLSASDYAIHKERVIRRRNDQYLSFLEQGGLEDNTINQNEFMRIFGLAAIDKALLQVEAEDINEVLRSQINPTGLS